MRAWPLLPVHGVKTGIVWSKQLDAARLYLWCSNPVKRSSLIGAKIGPLFGGERVKLQVAHTKLSHSRAFLVRAYPLQTHEMLFDAHWHAFRVFGGVPGRGRLAAGRPASAAAAAARCRGAAAASPAAASPATKARWMAPEEFRLSDPPRRITAFPARRHKAAASAVMPLQ